MPVGYLPAPAQGGILPATSIGLHGASAQPTISGMNPMGSMDPETAKLMKAMIAAKLRQKFAPAQPASPAQPAGPQNTGAPPPVPPPGAPPAGNQPPYFLTP